MKLKDKKCVPCESHDKPMTRKSALALMAEIPEWVLEKNSKKISRTIRFPSFMSAMKWVNAVAKVAEREGHHPDIFVWYNKARLDLWTHSIGGLSENDFIVAAKINRLKR